MYTYYSITPQDILYYAMHTTQNIDKRKDFMITTKQRAFLRGLGNALEPVMQIGKDGVTDNVLNGVYLLLEARELVKVKVLKNCDMDAKEIAHLLAQKLDAEVVQVIGSIFILYKKSTRKDFKHIELP